jgi:hypothetical protein
MSINQNNAISHIDGRKVCREEARKTSGDLLLEAVKELDGCLNDKAFDHIVNGDLRTMIQELRDRTETIRIKMDTSSRWTSAERPRTEDRGEINVA